jgi:class I lanthipeptide synthase
MTADDHQPIESSVLPPALAIDSALRTELLARASALFERSAELSRQSSDPLVTSAHAYFAAHWLASGARPPPSCSTAMLNTAIGRTIALLPETELGPALADGYLAVAWMTNSASAIGLDGPDVVPDDVVDAALAEDLPALQQTGYYDFLNGVAGTLWFELHRKGGPRPRVATERLEVLAAMSHSNDTGRCWWTALPIARWGMDSGYYDLGFAHGQAGVAAALAKAHQLLPSARTRSLLESAIAAYDALLAEHPGHFVPHASVPGQSPDRHAWCYGTPGVAMGMFAAARALNHRERADDWARRLGLALADDASDARLDSAGFCHGAAGLALIAMQSAAYLGEQAHAYIRNWLQRAIGFTAETTFTASDNPLLDGPAGIGLIFLSAISGRGLDGFEILGIPRLEDAMPQYVRTE